MTFQNLIDVYSHSPLTAPVGKNIKQYCTSLANWIQEMYMSLKELHVRQLTFYWHGFLVLELVAGCTLRLQGWLQDSVCIAMDKNKNWNDLLLVMVDSQTIVLRFSDNEYQ